MANSDSTLTQSYLHELFEYKDGSLYWKNSRAKNSVKAGSRAGCVSSLNYRYIKINNISYKEHRLIFLMHHGYLPKIIDHIDANPANNSIENLRECTASQNRMNAKLNINSSSNIKGVSWHKRKNKWIANCCIDKKLHHIGYFVNKEDAEVEVKKFRENNHKEFSRNR